MRKLFLLTLLVLVSATGAFAQAGSSQSGDDIPNMGRAPREPNGIGRLDLRVVDEQGNPVQGVRADLRSNRTDGFTCESWNWTDARGVSVLPPLHMGRLTLTLKAKGFATQKVQVLTNSLDQPVRVTMIRKG
ncbi:MAG TPA: carboxypeptidase-like regulatory domain-containing protein [Pyrinomonadaceae bacterium]